MKPDDFDYVSRLLRERSGLVLTRDKAYLLESRLMPLARKRGLKGLDDLMMALKKRDAALETLVVEAMTTNESFFFRDNKPFDQFKSIVLPNLIKARAARKSFRIWSAACSSGQEPYSLAMLLREESARLNGWKIDIVGTDISREILDKARSGTYSQFEVQRGMPMALLVKYFKKKDENWVIDPAIKSMVQYKELNLLGDLRGLGQFDVVFCRNVLIYFDQPTKSKVLNAISQIMADDAVLYLGGAETVLGVSDKFKPVPGQRGIYALARGDGASSLGAPPG
ncbi:protein-glutamate O-methyltransferase CheR [uncultured Rhodospira sp.]|uniref:CheR family methyltransferase n=1 Tax=uncultured Rhodospira sp. TaxID=1936189 RepID=UPI00260B2EB9|nr:protein-glutamate O-methyltransferase [uncultured Rhodospira sp.]